MIFGVVSKPADITRKWHNNANFTRAMGRPMEPKNTFYCPADARGEVRSAATIAALWVAFAVFTALYWPGWHLFIYLPVAIVGVGAALNRWQSVRRGHLSADAFGVTVQLGDKKDFYPWAEYEDMQWHEDASPGILRLVHHAADGEVRSAVTIPWHRFRTTSTALLEGLERARQMRIRAR